MATNDDSGAAKRKHGGARAGAGRKAKRGARGVPRALVLTPETWALIDGYRRDGESRTDAFARALASAYGVDELRRMLPVPGAGGAGRGGARGGATIDAGGSASESQPSE